MYTFLIENQINECKLIAIELTAISNNVELLNKCNDKKNKKIMIALSQLMFLFYFKG